MDTNGQITEKPVPTEEKVEEKPVAEQPSAGMCLLYPNLDCDAFANDKNPRTQQKHRTSKSTK